MASCKGLLLGAALAAALFGAHGAEAQQGRRVGFPPSYRTGLFFPAVVSGGLSGYCGVNVASISGTLTTCADTLNGSYYSSGAVQGSFAAAGGVLNGCLITAGSGLRCTGTNTATLPAGNPTSNYCVITRAVNTYSGSSISINSEQGTVGPVYYRTGGTDNYGLNGGAVTSTTNSGSSEVAVCVGATTYSSLNGGAAVSTTYSYTTASETLYLGNQSGKSYSNSLGNGYLVSVLVVTLSGPPTAAIAQAAAQL